MNSGSEAVQMAIRPARGYAKRNVIVKFEGACHRWVDSVAHTVHPSIGLGQTKRKDRRKPSRNTRTRSRACS